MTDVIIVVWRAARAQQHLTEPRPCLHTSAPLIHPTPLNALCSVRVLTSSTRPRDRPCTGCDTVVPETSNMNE